MYIEKNHDMIEVRCCRLGTTYIDDSVKDNAVVIGFDGGVFTLAEGQNAEITTNDGTSSVCNVGDEKCIFTKCLLSLHGGRVLIDIWNNDDNVGLHLLNLDNPKMNNTFFGVKESD